MDDAQRSPFAALRLRGLCERAGLSSGAFYVHWPSLETFYGDLAQLLTVALDPDPEILAEIAQTGGERTPLEAIARVADQDLQLLVDNPLWDVIELVSLTWGRTSLQSQLAQSYETTDRATGQIYGQVLTRLGREPRAPLDWDTIGIVLQALAEGTGLRHKIDPAAVPASSQSGIGVYATAVSALLAVLTWPRGDKASAAEAIEALLRQSG